MADCFISCGDWGSSNPLACKIKPLLRCKGQNGQLVLDSKNGSQAEPHLFYATIGELANVVF